MATMGQRLLIVDNKGRRYLVTLKEGGEFHSHNGFVPHEVLAAAAIGVVASLW